MPRLTRRGQSASFLVTIPLLLITSGLLWVYVIGPAMLPVKIQSAQVSSAYGIADRTYAPDNAIYNYEWFKKQHEKILSTERQIDNTQEELKLFVQMNGNNATLWNWQQQQEYSRLQAVKLGLMNFYEDLIADYQAKQQMANRNIFQDGLPLDIDKKMW